MRVVRVLFYDYWTKGIANFRRIIEATDPGTAEYQLFHLGSFRAVKTPRFEMLHGLPCVDVKAFAGMKLDQIIDSFEPDVVVGLNFGGLFDRAMFLTCKRMNIPTAFVQHGTWLDLEAHQAFLKTVDRRIKMRDALERMPKLAWVIPCYLRACDLGVFDPAAWRVFGQLLRAPATSHFFPAEPKQICPTLLLVHTTESSRLVRQALGVPPEKVRILGNPEWDAVVGRRLRPLSAEQQLELVQSWGLRPRVPLVCYVEDAFVEMQGFWSEEQRVREVRELHRTCQSLGVQLMVRPHPATNPAAMERELADQPGVVVTRQPSLLNALDLSTVVVGTVSTALETALILKKPILVPVWHAKEVVEQSPLLATQAATPVQESKDLPSSIECALRLRSAAPGAGKYIQERFGHLDGRAAHRIASTILELGSHAKL